MKLLILFVFIQSVSGFSQKKEHLKNVDLLFQIGGTSFSWHNEENKFKQSNFQPMLGMQAGFYLKPDAKVNRNVFWGGQFLFNYLKTFNVSNRENLIQNGFQLKIFYGFNFKRISLELYPWLILISHVDKKDDYIKSTLSGYQPSQIKRIWSGVGMSVNYQVSEFFFTYLSLDASINSVYNSDLFRLGFSPDGILHNYANWLSFGVRLNLFKI